jgi:hypothetical protein
MTEPDEALLWARERAAQWQDEGGGEAGPAYRRGDLDFLLGEEVEGYRAGAAASEARIKELEAALKDSVTAMRLLLDAVQKHNAESDTFLSGFPLHLLSIEIAAACALLKDGDQ